MEGNPVDISINLCSSTSTKADPKRGWVCTIEFWAKGYLPTGQIIRKDLHAYEFSTKENDLRTESEFRAFGTKAILEQIEIARVKMEEIKQQLTGFIDPKKAFKDWVFVEPEKVPEPPLRNPYRGM